MARRNIDWDAIENEHTPKNIAPHVPYGNPNKIILFQNGTKTKTEDIAKHV